jgi:hypothetical protein
MREIQDRLTPLPEREYILTAAKAWKRFYGRGPKASQLSCCLAQMVLETGRRRKPGGDYDWGVYAHNFNWGNIKSRPNDGSHWQFYDCGEEVSLREAEHLAAKDPALVEIRKRYTWGNGSKRASIWLRAPHPWCRFRAYETAEDGLIDYIDFLVMERTRYLKAWNEGVMKGDPVTFSLELGKAGYYTADPQRYTKTVVSLFNEFQPKVREVLASSEGQAIYADEEEEWRKSVHDAVMLSIHQHFHGVTDLDEDEARRSQTTNEGFDLSTTKGIQGFLLDQGYDLGHYGADGDYGKLTTAAVAAFQKRYGLEGEGQMNPETRGKMAEFLSQA